MTRVYNKSGIKMQRKMLRNNLTETEKILWSCLKGKNLVGFKFRRQYSVGRYILDFYCPKLKLAIEIDGDAHFTKDVIEYDKVRQHLIEDFSIRFLRFTNTEIRNNFTS